MQKKAILGKFFNTSLVLIFLFGVFLRIKTFLYNRSFWCDEAALALNITDRGFLELLKPLDYIQCAPYLFSVLSKVMINLFGIKELVFRTLPLLFGILSIFAFYFLSKRILNKKWSILAANLLFAINFEIVYYSQEFKQYSLEMLVAILSVLYFSSIDVKNITYKKCVFTGLLFFVFFLVSMPTPLILGAYILYLIYRNKKESLRQVFYILVPFCLLALPYYLFYLIPSKEEMLIFCSYLWDVGYIVPKLDSIKTFVLNLLNFTFFSCKNYILLIMFITFGAFLTYKDKKKVGGIMLLILLAAFLAAVLYMYPIYHRLGLYLVPFLILLAIKPLDTCSVKEFKSAIYTAVLVLAFIFCFRTYNISYISEFFNPTVFNRGISREMMDIIKDKISSNDFIVYNSLSESTCIYYQRRFNIENVRHGELSLMLDRGFKNITDGNIWLYFTYWDQDKEYIDKALKLAKDKSSAKILFEKRELGSYILKVDFKPQ